MSDEKNLLQDNEFSVKVKTKDGEIKEIKEIKLKTYSFSTQLKLMESGLLNELIDLSKSINADNQVDAKQVDFKKLGGLLRVSVQIIYEMLPAQAKLTNDLEKFTDDIYDGEAMRFVNWIMDQFKKSNDFLVPAPQEKMRGRKSAQKPFAAK